MLKQAGITALALCAAAGATEPNVDDYAIAAIDFLPTPMEKVGKLQAGLWCLPKGTLRWRDIAKPEMQAMAIKLGTILSEGGLSVAPRPDPLFGDSAPLTKYRIRVVVEEVSLRLCVPGLGIGEKAPSGKGSAKIRWETYDRVGRVRIDDIAFEIPLEVDRRDARGTSGMLADALAESAARYTARRVR